VTDPGAALLAVILLLTLKHFVCDYPLQTSYQLKNKGTYGHPGGLLHAGIHAIGTTVSFIAITPSLALGALIVVGEFIVHYHLDWAKENVIRREGWTAKDANFWLALGVDQLAHHLTYIGIAAILWIYAT
jgi:hypothetical protein